ncbi:hypothetical protein ASPFODRAFT_392706 [Aspergillus luchuensis CBS 106.47]|uniref:Uncharacterized protein n=1 Tax=Aspergillus luchuensis (strain CBS 106.47) TaxID=1137211 RepID=A0A1M3T254_ASPLC|nr:hypothetical protein ASPFODRAFT_392706 [Aspergillus luchuensis CBS 106.47]
MVAVAGKEIKMRRATSVRDTAVQRGGKGRSNGAPTRNKNCSRSGTGGGHRKRDLRLVKTVESADGLGACWPLLKRRKWGEDKQMPARQTLGGGGGGRKEAV